MEKDNNIGRLLDGRYEILEVLGTGGMAVVYKARCHRLNRLEGIKILKDELGKDEEFRDRFHGHVREAVVHGGGFGRGEMDCGPRAGPLALAMGTFRVLAPGLRCSHEVLH